MQLLMPFLVEMTSCLLDIVSVHDMKNLISYSLSIAGALSNECEHGSQKVLRRKEDVRAIIGQIILILLTNFGGETELCGLKFFWFGVESLLPGELFGEAVTKPNVKVDDVISVEGISFT